jgi:hypothetical protein
MKVNAKLFQSSSLLRSFTLVCKQTFTLQGLCYVAGAKTVVCTPSYGSNLKSVDARISKDLNRQFNSPVTNMILPSNWRINKDHALEDSLCTPLGDDFFFFSGNLVSAGELWTWRGR